MNSSRENYDQKLSGLKNKSGKVLHRKQKIEDTKNFIKEHAPKKRDFVDKHQHLVPHGEKEEIDLLNGVLSQVEKDIQKFENLIQKFSIDQCDQFDYQHNF
jgi:hypothetical protein